MKKASRLIMVLPLMIMMLLYLPVNLKWAIEQRNAWQVILSILCNLLPLLLFSIVDAWNSPQKGILAYLFRASFYVYLLIVMSLTLLWVDFGSMQFTASAWKNNFQAILNERWTINLQPFRIYRDYGTFFHRQILGNFVMLLPLGIYLPSLYLKCRKFWAVALSGLGAAISIEFLQFILTHVIPFANSPAVRSVDIDDVLLNSIGVVIGYMLFKGSGLARKRA